jgi:hypothetical protein
VTDHEVADAFVRLPEWVNADEALMRRGRWLSVDFLLHAGTIPLYASVREGRLESIARGPLLMRSWRFAIRAQADAWSRFWKPVPEPGYHDLLALTRFGRATLEGDLQPLMANLRYVKEILELPRARLHHG